MEIKKEANEAVAQMAKEESLNTLEKVLSESVSYTHLTLPTTNEV